MEKKYVYENGIVYISMTDGCVSNIRKATEIFLKNIMVEKKRSK